MRPLLPASEWQVMDLLPVVRLADYLGNPALLDRTDALLFTW